MSFMDHLSDDVVHLLGTRVTAEYATLSSAGVPIDTPTYYFVSEDRTTLDIGTGLAYPAKAERARKNPKVGLLIEGADDQPVVSITGIASVQDTDLQANLERYLSETIYSPLTDPELNDWQEIRHGMLYYLTRIIVRITPSHVRWWRNRAAMDGPPHEWRAQANTVYPASDPAPAGKASPAPQWEQPSWQDLRQRALGEGMPAHLTLLDADGHPLPLRVRSCKEHRSGFALDVPAGSPWTEGRATLSFIGKQIFVGDVVKHGSESVLHVERALPVWPLMTEKVPSEHTLDALTKRLWQELDRRGLSLPVVPELPPEPTEGAKLRRPGYGTARRAAVD